MTQTAEALDRLRAALSDLGVASGMREAIGALAQACAVHRPLQGPEEPYDGAARRTGKGTGDATGAGTATTATPDSASRTGVAYSSLAVPDERQWADDAVLQTVQSAEKVQAWAEYISLLAVRALTARAGAELLARADVTDERELPSQRRRERFRAATRAAVRLELSALTGWTQAGCNERIGVATAAPLRAGFAMQQLASGEASWTRVRAWAYRTSRFDAEDAGRVSTACLDPVTAHSDATQRVDPETGEVTGHVMSFNQFKRVLEREAVRVEGGADQSARQRRREELAGRDLYTRMFEHGTGQMSLTGDGPALAAAAARIDSAARRMRAAGDSRSLSAIRADTALALLGHGQLSGPPERHAGSGTGTDSGSGIGIGTGTDPVRAVAGDLATMSRVLRGLPSASVEIVMPIGVIAGATDAVAEVSGYGFITGEHARELLLEAGTDGTTIHRLLTDPADGRCVERSRASYRPDAAMLHQLRAADGTCRAPGCTVPASRSDLDHEVSYDHDNPSAGGPTSETNLNHKHRFHHWAKTEELWATAMDALSRRVTWHSLFGRCYRTAPKDYRPLGPPNRPGAPPPDDWSAEGCREHSHPDVGSEHVCRRRRTAERDRRDRRRHTELRRAGSVVRYHDFRWIGAMHELLDRMYYDAGPGQVLPEALADLPAGPGQGGGASGQDGDASGHGADGPRRRQVPMSTLLYSAIAEHQSARGDIDHPSVTVTEAMPVDVAHLRGGQLRHGARRGLPDPSSLLGLVGSRELLEEPKADPDEAPPF